MSPLKIACPTCRTALQAAMPFGPGQKVRCGQCGSVFALAGTAAPAACPRSHPTTRVERITRAQIPVAAASSHARAAPAAGRQPAFLVAGIVAAALALGAVGLVLLLRRAGPQEQNVASTAEAGRDSATASPHPPPIRLTPLEEEETTPRRRVIDSAASREKRRDPLGGDSPATPRSLSTLSPERQEAVNRAIDRGVAFLKQQQLDGGSWNYSNNPIGQAALPGLTLLECGVPANDDAVQRAAQFVREHCDDLNHTYSLALAILFLDRLGDPQDRPLLQTLAVRLIVGQHADGGWGYSCPIPSTEQHREIFAHLEKTRPASPADLLKPITEVRTDAPKRSGRSSDRESSKLSPALKELPALRDKQSLRANPNGDHSDNSNSQFAILALWAAQRQGVPLERTMALVAQRYQSSQNADGGWGYHASGGRTQTTPSMTCVGLLGLAVGHGLFRDDRDAKRSVDDPNLLRGLDALSKHIGEPNSGKSKRALTDLYFLWSVERVGMLFGVKTIGEKDWYAWAVEMLLAHPSPQGSWRGQLYPGSTPILDTSFALLVLKRANFVHDLSTKIEFLKIELRRKE